MKKRLPYIIIFIVLTGIEFCIGLFIHDDFIRPYLGDVIIIWVLYCFVRIISPDKPSAPYNLIVEIVAFAAAVEFLQMINIVDILGIENRFLRTLIGTSFSYEDIECYFAGGFINMIGCIIYIFLFKNNANKNE